MHIPLAILIALTSSLPVPPFQEHNPIASQMGLEHVPVHEQAIKSDPEAQFQLAKSHMNPSKTAPTDVDLSTALFWAEHAAKNNHAGAKLLVNELNEHGVAPSSMPRVYITSMNKLVEEGHIPAMMTLGKMYSDGLRFAPNYQTAFKYYLKAANLGNVDAELYVANAFSHPLGIGIGVGVNPDLALKYYERAANHGSAPAIVQVIKMFMKPGSMEKSVDYAKMAVRKGHIIGATYLAKLYKLGIYEIPKSDEKSFKYYKLLAEHADKVPNPGKDLVDAQVRMAWINEHGVGVGVDMNMARYWSWRAVQNGHVFDMAELDSRFSPVEPASSGIILTGRKSVAVDQSKNPTISNGVPVLNTAIDQEGTADSWT